MHYLELYAAIFEERNLKLAFSALKFILQPRELCALLTVQTKTEA